MMLALPRCVPHTEEEDGYCGLRCAAGERVSANASSDEAALLARVRAGAPGAMCQLVRHLSPGVHAAVARTLLQYGRSSALRNVREETRDMSQDAFAVLFADNGRVLDRWDPAGGLSLGGFAAMVARRRTISSLRSRVRNPWQDDPTDCQELARMRAGEDSHEAAVAARQLLDVALERVRANQSERGRTMLDLLVVQDLDNDEAGARSGLSRGATYQWRSRLLKAVRVELQQLLVEAR